MTTHPLFRWLLLLNLVWLPLLGTTNDYVLKGRVVDTAGVGMPGVMVKAAEIYCNELDQCAMLVDLAYTPADVTDGSGYFEIRTAEFPRNASLGWVISYQDGEQPVPCFYQFDLNVSQLAMGWWVNGVNEVEAGTAVCPSMQELGW